MLDETVILRPVVTEKSARLAQDNQYVFMVNLAANKIQVTAAVQRIFKVKVLSVRLMNYAGKRKRRRMKWIHRAATKKAIVTLAKGQTIDAAALT